MPKQFEVFATDDIKQRAHTWTYKKGYLVTENKGSFTLETNEGKLTYPIRMKKSALKYFDIPTTGVL